MGCDWEEAVVNYAGGLGIFFPKEIYPYQISK